MTNAWEAATEVADAATGRPLAVVAGQAGETGETGETGSTGKAGVDGAARRDPVLIDVPLRLQTARLVLRAPQAGDGLALNEAVRESLPELRPWMPWARSEPTLAESEAYCRRQHARFLLREDLPMLIFQRAFGGAQGRTGELLGATGLHRIDWALRRFEIGYWARRGHAGQGYVSEAVRELARMAFEVLQAERVEVRMDERNEASQRVAEAAGFEFEGVLRHEAVDVDGRPRDTRVYARVRTAL